MIFRTIENGSNGWKSLGYTTTWGYGWDFMLDAAQALIDVDWKTGLVEFYIFVEISIYQKLRVAHVF